MDPNPFSNTSRNLEGWNKIYPEVYRALPGKVVEPLRKTVRIRVYVDTNHAGNLVNRRSHSGIMIYLNNTPILWFCKRQNAGESFSFCSKYVALILQLK